jgi:hypothetical protein
MRCFGTSRRLLNLDKFRSVLPQRRFRGGPTLYLFLLGVGFGISLLCVLVLPFLRFSWQGLLLFVSSLVISFLGWYDFVYQEVLFPERVLRELLDVVVIGAWALLVVFPIAYTALGDWPLVGMTLGMLLSWSILGAEVYRYKRRVKRSVSGGETTLATSAGDMNEYSGPELRSRSEFVASVFIVLSAATMFWMLAEFAIDPSTEFIQTAYDWIPWTLWLLLYIGALIVLYQALRKQQARLFMLSALMASLSFTGFLSVIAEVIIWRTHKRHQLPWGREEALGASIMQDELGLSRTLAYVSGGVVAGAATLAGYLMQGWLNWLVILIVSVLSESILLGFLSDRIRSRRHEPPQ